MNPLTNRSTRCSEISSPDDTLLEIQIGPAKLTLLPEKAAWSAATRELFIADLHLGKARAFRSNGLPIPEGTVTDDLQRLDDLIETLRPRHCWIVGDLFHSAAGQSNALTDQLSEWRQRHHEMRLTLLTGNHDRKIHQWAPEWALERTPSATAACGLQLFHHPLDPPGGTPALSGHLHPGVRLRAGGRFLPVRPAFVLENLQLILPAFGSLTGCARCYRREGVRFFITAEDRVREIPPQLL